MKRVALVLVGLTVGLLLNPSPTQAGRAEAAALLCQRFKNARGPVLMENLRHGAAPGQEAALAVLDVLHETLCDQ